MAAASRLVNPDPRKKGHHMIEGGAHEKWEGLDALEHESSSPLCNKQPNYRGCMNGLQPSVVICTLQNYMFCSVST